MVVPASDVSQWRQTLSYRACASFCRSFRLWAPWAAAFIAIVLLLDTGALYARLHLPATPASQNQIGPGILGMLSIMVRLLSIYFFTVVYLRAAPLMGQSPVSHPGPGNSGFWYWFSRAAGKCVVVGLALIPVFAAGGFIFAQYTINPHYAPGRNLSLGLALLTVISTLLTTFLAIRLIIVTPLAVTGISPVFKNSWRLTQHNEWRIFGNSLVIFLISIFVTVAVTIIPLVIAKAAAPVPLSPSALQEIITWLQVICQDICFAPLTVLSVIFNCTAADVLMREQQHNIEQG